MTSQRKQRIITDTHDYYGKSTEQLYDQVELSKKCFKLNGFAPETIFNEESNVAIVEIKNEG